MLCNFYFTKKVNNSKAPEATHVNLKGSLSSLGGKVFLALVGKTLSSPSLISHDLNAHRCPQHRKTGRRPRTWLLGSLTVCVTLGKALNVPKPQFPLYRMA